MAIYAYGKKVPKIDPTAYVFPSADIIGKVSIGAKVFVGAGVVIRGDYGKVIVGDGSAIEEHVTIHTRVSGTCTIGKDVTVGHAAVLHNCTVQDGCLIGMKSIVSDYCVIGEGAVVAEGAVVKSKTTVEPGTIVAGVPAKKIGTVPEKHKEFWAAAKVVYQDLCASYPKRLKKVEEIEREG